MAGKTIDFNELVGDLRDGMAAIIAQHYQEWEALRMPWAQQKQELRNYLFATDTSTTSNKALPWKNSTTMPKLTQIRDNLHSNYMAALFPTEDWLRWEGDNRNDELEAKRNAIQNYMRTKLRQDRAEVKIGQLLLDWIDNGNCFGTAIWVDESTVDEQGNVTRGYVGPRIVRIPFQDLVFNPVVANFEEAPKIHRVLKNIGELVDEADGMPVGSDEYNMMQLALNKGMEIRQQVSMMSQGDSLKSDAFSLDGFSSLQQYFGSNYVELLTFYGDMYDAQNKKFYKNYQITVMDRAFVVGMKPNPNWTSHAGIFHAGWRQRPDNLYAMGPLDNLVGLQYRIDHLENLRADVFDMIAYPMVKRKGYVEDFNFMPGMQVNVGDEGDVEFLHPPHEALAADNQIDIITARMEEMVGAPKEAMGIRTPGEKTKFEVQKLDNAASRIFQNKIEHFQKVFLEPLLNYMLQLARRNMASDDVTRTTSSELDAVIFSTITKDDIVANGVLRPIGAQHYADRANALQNLVAILNSPAGADPTVMVHISGKNLAKALIDLADMSKYNLYGENIRVLENSQTQKLMAAASEQTEIQAATPAGITEGDPDSGPVS